MFMKRELLKNNNGFTLIELMVTLFLTAIAVVAIYRGYTSFSQAADAQEQIIEMQQNLRIGMYMLEKDLRRAGMNEEEDETAGFILGEAGTVRFTLDWTGGGTDGIDNDFDGSEDGFDPENIDDPVGAPIEVYDEDNFGDGELDDPGEDIQYSVDANGQLIRNDFNGTGAVAIISNVDALNFVYFGESGTGPPLPLPMPLSAANLQNVHSVQVSLLVHTTNEDYRHTDDLPYENLQGDVIFDASTDAVGDQKHLRRRVLSKQVKIRNAGL
jgi:prepilin-type N-terminal cleavage/methylation domain-containing protein